ncbi:MAG: Zn-dependent oligopeptidase [Candidatus Marinimicrobia bacterium]|nr:Zn-dependent oligopeptidase [Candidatus Neomarinimicrobiota bacterium]MCF7903949.1 Zn-dependent oligopeptidase [Candidatus Neomarinimicrobiota bacterium]
MKQSLMLVSVLLLIGCLPLQQAMDTAPAGEMTDNPFIHGFNEIIPFAEVRAEDIPEATDLTLEKAQGMLDDIIAIKDGDHTFANTIVAIDDISYELAKVWYPVYLMGSVHPEEAVRNNADSAVLKFSAWETDFSLNEDLFNAVETFATTEAAKVLTGEDKVLFDDTYEGFLRQGFGLPKEKRDEIKKVRNELSKIGQDFSNNISNYTDTLVVTEAQMDGTPQWYKDAYRHGDVYKIDISYPARRTFMQLSTDADARKALSEKFLNRAADSNVELIPTMVETRHKLARILGYDSYADYLLEERMPKNPETVWTFEKELNAALKEKLMAEKQELLELKSRLSGKKEKEVNYWELHFLENIVGEEKYSLNEEEIAEYFELTAVRDGFFAITQKVFGLNFKQIENPSVWHEDVTMYEVFDSASGKRLGYFYLDLFPRENKYNHAAHFGINKGKQTKDGYQYPVASLVCNFTKPEGDKPSLLKHKSEVATFFHEFGHLIHGMVTTAKYFAHSGTSVDRDFVEAPSQIFENWVWDKESLQIFAKHYETGEAIPDALLESMLAAKNMTSGGDMAFQVFLGTQDLTLYDTWGKEDTGESLLEMSRRVHKDILYWNETPNTARIASFGHLNGYAASYYGYAWAEVFAQDMFSVFERDGVLNPEVGMRFRNDVLAPGGSKEALDLVEGFLGRKSNNEAFKRSLGL